MLVERKLLIRQLFSHPAGIGQAWSWKLVQEMLDEIEHLSAKVAELEEMEKIQGEE
tara:strand:- start:363 stop:530 length:168 start_codon:yes stop_codon:yes gene_type:complete